MVLTEEEKIIPTADEIAEGEKDAEKEFEDATKDLNESQKKGLRGLKSRLKQTIEGKHWESASQWLDRWAEMSGCPGDHEKIDWENPYIYVEFWMCDAPTLLRLSNPRTREKELERFPPEARDVYLNKIGPGCSKKYCDVYLTPGMIKRGVKKELKSKQRAEFIKGNLSDEERQAKREMVRRQKEERRQRRLEEKMAKKKSKKG